MLFLLVPFLIVPAIAFVGSAIWLFDRHMAKKDKEHMAMVTAKFPQRQPPDDWSIQIGEPDF